LLLFDKRVREIKNEVSIRHLLSRTLYFCHMSRSISVSSLVCQDTLFLSLIDFFDHMLMCSFSEEVDLDSNTTQRSPEVDHGHGAVTHEWGADCGRNLSHWISEKGPWRKL